jgi:hypothetical protein
VDLGEARPRSRADGGTQTLNPNVIGGGARLPPAAELPMPAHLAGELREGK